MERLITIILSRFIVNSVELYMPEMAKILQKEFQAQGYTRVLTRRVPDWLLHLLAWFGMKEAKFSSTMVGQQKTISNQRAREILGMEHLPQTYSRTDSNGKDKEVARELLLQLTYSAIQLKVIPDLSPQNRITKEYQLPAWDLSMIPHV